MDWYGSVNSKDYLSYNHLFQRMSYITLADPLVEEWE